MNEDTRKQEADKLVQQFLVELDACQTEDQRIAKAWELIYGIIKAARKQEVTK